MTDFENKVRDIMMSSAPEGIKLAEIRKLCTLGVDPSTCKDDRLYLVIVDGTYESIGWRNSNSALPWAVKTNDGFRISKKESAIDVICEYVPEDKHYGKVYERIEDAVADGMGKNSIVSDRDGDTWEFDATDKYGRVFSQGRRIENEWGPFTVVHWVPKEAGE